MEPGLQLIEATKENDSGCIEHLLSLGVSADVRDSDGYTPLYWACCRGYVGECRRLLRRSCDVNARGKAGATALMACADNGRTTCLHLLLQHRSILLNEVSERGDSALHLAAYRGHLEIVTLLCLAGADTDIRNQDHQTPLGQAYIEGHLDCYRYLNETALRKQQSDENKSLAHENDPEILVSGDSALGLSIPSFLGEITPMNIRRPECMDERSLPGNGRAQLSLRNSNSLPETGYKSRSPVCGERPSSSVSLSSGFGNPAPVANEGYHDNSVIHSSSTNRSQTVMLDPGHCTNGVYAAEQHVLPSPDSHGYHSSHSLDVRIGYPPSVNPLCHHHCSGIRSDDRQHSHSNSNSLFQSPPSVNDLKPSSSNDLSRQSGLMYQGKPKEPFYRFNISPDENSTPGTETNNVCPSGDDEGTTTTTTTTTSSNASNPLLLANRHLSRGGDNSGGTNAKREMLPGLPMATFIENLQMTVLTLEDSLNREKKAKAEMTREMNKVTEENKRLKALVKDMSARYSELSKASRST